MTPLLYLAHPIDHGNLDGRVKLAEQIAHTDGWAVYDPGKAWRVPKGGQPNGNLQQINMAAVSRCNAILAILDPGVMTLGVPMELAVACSLEIPAAIWSSMTGVSWALPEVPIFTAAGAALDHLEGMQR